MADRAPPSMRADDVRRDMRDQKRKREAVYDSVLGMIHKSILKKAGVGGLRLNYEIPFIVVGKPVIKVDDCVRYILTSLQGDGYTVRFRLPKSVHVSWDSDERRRYPKLTPSEINDISENVKRVVYHGPRGVAPAPRVVDGPGRKAGVRLHKPEPPCTETAKITANAGGRIGSNTGGAQNSSGLWNTGLTPYLHRPGNGQVAYGNLPCVQGPPQTTPRTTQQNTPGPPGPPGPAVPRGPGRPMLPWEVFESTQPLRNQGLSLLPPPQMTVTHMCEIPRDPGAPIPSFAPGRDFGIPESGSPEASAQKRCPKPPFRGGAAALSVEKIGPGGGLVLNL